MRLAQQRAAQSWSAPEVTFGDTYTGPRELPSGLRYCRDFVDSSEQAEILLALDGAWKRHIRRAQQFFGFVYYQTSHDLAALQPESPAAQHGRPLENLPPWLLPRVHESGAFGERMVNQVQGNEYLEDSGIGIHVEDPAAGPAFATLSLLEPIQLTLQRAVDGKPVNRDVRDQDDVIKVLLEPRSYLVLAGESRSSYAHCIRQSRLVHLPDGDVRRRGKDYRRVSLTFRSIVEEMRSAERKDTPEGFDKYVVVHPA